MAKVLKILFRQGSGIISGVTGTSLLLLTNGLNIFNKMILWSFKLTLITGFFSALICLRDGKF